MSHMRLKHFISKLDKFPVSPMRVCIATWSMYACMYALYVCMYVCMYINTAACNIHFVC